MRCFIRQTVFDHPDLFADIQLDVPVCPSFTDLWFRITCFANEKGWTLSPNINPSGGSIHVSNGGAYGVGQHIAIDNDPMTITAVNVPSATITLSHDVPGVNRHIGGTTVLNRDSPDYGYYGFQIYRTRAGAENATPEDLLFDYAAPAGTDVTLTIDDSNYEFLIAPTLLNTQIVYTLQGAWQGVMLACWTAQPEMLLLRQVETVLKRYCAAGEFLALSGVKQIAVGFKEPTGLTLPAVCVLLGEHGTAQDQPAGPFDEVQVPLTLYVVDNRGPVDTTMQAVAGLVGALRTIVEEQRYWGWSKTLGQGPIVGTTITGIVPARPYDLGSEIYNGWLSLMVEFRGLRSSNAPALNGWRSGADGVGQGGRYGDPPTGLVR